METKPLAFAANVAHSVAPDGTITLVIKGTAEGKPSASGKSILIASTRGTKSIALANGTKLFLGLNLYRKVGE